MTIDGQVRDEKLQYDIKREPTKISALSSDKIDKYKYLWGEEILPSNHNQIIEQAKFTYSPLGKAFEKKTKTIEDQREKQVKTLKDSNPHPSPPPPPPPPRKNWKWLKALNLMITKSLHYINKFLLSFLEKE